MKERLPSRATQTAARPSRSGILQRKCACGNHTSAGGTCESCRKTGATSAQSQIGLLQRRDAGIPPTPKLAPPIVHEVLRSSGNPLPANVRTDMESRFGADFSSVRLHTDARAAESARAVNAHAYTVGNNVVLPPGNASGRPTDQHLLAHELAHVVQQDGATLLSASNLQIADSEGSSEREATAAAHNAITAGFVDRMNTRSMNAINRLPAMVSRSEDTKSPQTETPPQLGDAAPSATPPPKLSKVKVWLNSFIPAKQIKGPPQSECFTGDDRTFSNAIHASSRTHQEIEVTPSLMPTIDYKDTGASHEVNCKTGAVIKSAKASPSELTNGPVVGGSTGHDAAIHFSGAASNPLVIGAPAIDFVATFQIDFSKRLCSLDIEHDGFPAYEAYVTADSGAGVKVYNYDPTAAGEGITALFPPMDKEASVKAIPF